MGPGELIAVGGPERNPLPPGDGPRAPAAGQDPLKVEQEIYAALDQIQTSKPFTDEELNSTIGGGSSLTEDWIYSRSPSRSMS